MKIELRTSISSYNFNWYKSILDFKDEILFLDGKTCLLTDSGYYVMIGHIISFRVLGE